MTHHNPAADETKVELSDASKTLVAVDAWNPGADAAFIQLFSAPAGSVELGATVPDWVIPVPAGGGRDPVFPKVPAPGGGGARSAMEFLGGLSYAVTLTPDGADAPTDPITLSIAYV